MTMLKNGKLYEGYSFDLKQLSRNAGENPEQYKDFFEKALALLPRRILIYLDRQKFLFAEGGDGKLFPAACVTVQHYSHPSVPERLSVSSGGSVIQTFSLRPNWEDLALLERGGYYSETPLDYYDEAVSDYLDDDVFLRLVDCYDRSLAVTDEACFSPHKSLLKRAPGQVYEDACIISETDYRKHPDRLPGYFFFGTSSDDPERTASYRRFFRAASCMGTDGKEEVFRAWEESENARIWEDRHLGRSFSHTLIPVTDVFGEMIADIEIFALFPPVDVDFRIINVWEIVIQESRLCVREIQQYLLNEAFRESTYKYALSSIMTRNMSHNIGSHVYMHLTDPKVETFTVVKDVGPYRGLVESKEDVELDHLHQVAYLNSYIRNRMDFISDVSSRRPSSLSTWNIRGNVMKAFDRTRLLLNHISGLEGQFCFRIDVQNHVAKVDEQKYEGKPAEELEMARRNAISSDLEVGIPNNIIGWHALYNIIENVIRNVAKHGGATLPENVFTLSFSETELDPGLYEVLLYHNRQFSAEEAERIASVINAKLEAPVLVGAELRAGDLGIVEMEASAAVLRQLEGLSAVSHDHGVEPPLLEAVPVPCGKEGESYWGYRFYMLRPRDVFFVIQDETASDWNAMTVGTLKEFLAGGGVISHDFLVYDDDLKNEVEKLRERFRTALPVRMLGRGDLPKGSKPNRKACWIGWACLHESSWGTRSIKGDLSGTDTLASPCETAVLLSHNEDSQGRPLDLGKVVDSWCGKEDHIYLEALSWEGKAILPRFQKVRNMTEYTGNLKDNRWRPVLAELLEAINTRIFVLDEQIQDAAYGQNYMGASLKGLLELSGVRVPDLSKYNLKELNLDHDALLSLIGEEVVKNDFVVLHYGLLERIFKSLENPKDDWLTLMRGKMNEWLSLDGAGEIVVTSGRGVPKNLPDDVRFISSSAVFCAAVEVRSKFMLDKILHESRRINNT